MMTMMIGVLWFIQMLRQEARDTAKMCRHYPLIGKIEISIKLTRLVVVTIIVSLYLNDRQLLELEFAKNFAIGLWLKRLTQDRIKPWSSSAHWVAAVSLSSTCNTQLVFCDLHDKVGCASVELGDKMSWFQLDSISNEDSGHLHLNPPTHSVRSSFFTVWLGSYMLSGVE